MLAQKKGLWYRHSSIIKYRIEYTLEFMRVVFRPENELQRKDI